MITELLTEMLEEVPIDITAADRAGMRFGQHLAFLVGEGSAEGREFGVAHVDEDHVLGGGREFLATENAVRECERGSFIK